MRNGDAIRWPKWNEFIVELANEQPTAESEISRWSQWYTSYDLLFLNWWLMTKPTRLSQIESTPFFAVLHNSTRRWSASCAIRFWYGSWRNISIWLSMLNFFFRSNHKKWWNVKNHQNAQATCLSPQKNKRLLVSLVVRARDFLSHTFSRICICEALL